MNKKKSACIIGLGYYLPEKILTNQDLEKIVDTSDEWITTRTGIKERRIAAENEATSDLGYNAAKSALEAANVNPEEVELIIVATITPDMFFPATSCLIQQKLGAKNAAAFDMSAACTGYIYALSVGKQFIENGTYKKVLVIASDTMSRITNWEDRNTCVLFGDGAGAALLSAEDSDCGILSTYLAADGTHSDLLFMLGCGSRHPADQDVIDKKMQFLQMSGNEVFKLAVGSMLKSSENALNLAGLGKDDVSLVIPHQANLRIINAIAKRLKIGSERLYINIEKYGNMSGATVAVALAEAAEQDRLKKGDIICLTAFGAGLTSGAGVIKWGK
ncbi:beta-ketoacyl-ACP synthase III [bacterium]